MILKQLIFLQNNQIKHGFKYAYGNIYTFSKTYLQATKAEEMLKQDDVKSESYVIGVSQSKDQFNNEILPSAPIIPMLVSDKEPIVLSFDDVPGPKSLKYLANVRQYLSDLGTQLTASILTFGINLGAYFDTPKSFRTLSRLFDEYGPVVRFVSPVGKDIVLINHPDHIQKVYAMEGEHPIRSALDSLEKYRTERQNYVHGGLYTVHGKEWNRQRALIFKPLQNAICYNFSGICEICNIFTMKVYNMRNHQDEIPSDLYKEIHKWAFDCMGLITFGTQFNILNKDEHSQCDMAWLYNSFVNATEAIAKCESGLQLWKIFNTPAWNSLVVNCDILNSMIIKHVVESKQCSTVSTINIEQPADDVRDDLPETECVISSILEAEKMEAEDVATILMDMLLIGINTINSATGFLLYNLAYSQKCQKMLYKEIETITGDFGIKDIDDLKRMPYLQACLKETLSIPRGTLIIMSTKDSALKEGNYDDAIKFYPDRWLKPDAKDYHAFASIPFGFGARKCLGQNVAEVMLSILTIKLLGKYKMEYHYGDIAPTRGFIAKPNKPLKIRFIDRYKDI